MVQYGGGKGVTLTDLLSQLVKLHSVFWLEKGEKDGTGVDVKHEIESCWETVKNLSRYNQK